MTTPTRLRAEEIMARWRAGFRFAPALDRADGTASFPPGWTPSATEKVYAYTLAQLVAAEKGRETINAWQKRAGPLSRRRA